MRKIIFALGLSIAAGCGTAHAGIVAPGVLMNSPGMGEMGEGTLIIYVVPKSRGKPYVFSVK